MSAVFGDHRHGYLSFHSPGTMSGFSLSRSERIGFEPCQSIN